MRGPFDTTRRQQAGVFAAAGFVLLTYGLVTAAGAERAPDPTLILVGLAVLLGAVGVAVYDRFAP